MRSRGEHGASSKHHPCARYARLVYPLILTMPAEQTGRYCGRKGASALAFLFSVFLLPAGRASAQCAVHMEVVRRLYDEIVSYKKRFRQGLPDDAARFYLLPRYKRLLNLVRNCGKADEPYRQRDRYLEAGVLALQLNEWALAREYCDEFLGLIEYRDPNRAAARRCLDAALKAEGQHQRPVLPNGGLPETAPAPIAPAVPAATAPAPPKEAPSCSDCPQQVVRLPDLTMTKVLDCERTPDRDQTYACYRGLVTAHVSAASDRAAIARLAARATPPDSDNTDRARRKPRNDAMWGAGVALWVGAYIPTAIISGLYLARSPGFRPAETETLPLTVYGLLFVPLGGPFFSGGLFALSDYVTADEKIRYSVPWMIGSGLPQVLGLALVATGARRQKPATPVSLAGRIADSLLIVPQTTPSYAGLILSARY